MKKEELRKIKFRMETTIRQEIVDLEALKMCCPQQNHHILAFIDIIIWRLRQSITLSSAKVQQEEKK